jgi:tripartite-type tricarboxylate transporter receptor subunit TctC
MRRIALALAVSLTAGSALAAYDCTQVKLVVPYPAGGATDVATRVISERLEAALKKTVVVENRAGATGNVGTHAVVNAPADGCTLLVNATVIGTFPHSFSKLNYDPFKDLAPVGGIGITPVLIVAAPSVEANDLKSLIDWSKRKTDGLNYSTAGYGLQQHLAVEELAQRSGGKFTHVAYRGGGPAMTDLIAARLDFGAFLAGTTKPLLEDGKLKALAIAQDKRSELVPQIPTTAEQGFAGINAGTHFLLFAPAATAKDVVAMLSTELRKIIESSAIKERFTKIGFDPTPLSGEQAAAALRKTGEDYAPLIKKLNIKLD